MGASDRDARDVSLDARVRDVEAVVDALGLQRFALAGVDHAAATAVAYAAKNHTRVSHLVLICPWLTGVRRFALPDFKMATAAVPVEEREWRVYANVIGSV
jgi:pimeloyl-ACP methyl ester carboxylesterase